MKIIPGTYRICLLLALLLQVFLLPLEAQAAQPAGRFILTAETNRVLVIPPEYVSYEEGQTIGEALVNSGHTFTGIDLGQVSAIDDVTGNYTRSDQNGSYDLWAPAATVTHYRFSENTGGSRPNEGFLQLMTVMADYLEQPEDVQNAAKEAYHTAIRQWIGCSSEDAGMLAEELYEAMSGYEESLHGKKYVLTFMEEDQVYTSSRYPDISIQVKNPYGKVWIDEGDGRLELPAGSYHFCVEQDGLRAEGEVVVTDDARIEVSLPDRLWLKLDSFRLSGSYGADTNEEHKFTDDEFTLGSWADRETKVAVPDLFQGAVYVYAEYDSTLLSGIPVLTAVYPMANSGETIEKKLAFSSKTSGAYEVLDRGAVGNTVTYRVSHRGTDGYTYSQDYKVVLERIPTLTGITVVDQDGVDQAPSASFSGTVREYTYKVLGTVTSVTIDARPLEEDYTIMVNGQIAESESGVTIPVQGVTQAEVMVSTGTYTNRYQITIQPGEGKILSFLSDQAVTIEVVNSNGVVMPFTTHKETASRNRYKYTLVPGEVYRYIATKDSCYHITDDFRLEEVADSTITIDFAYMNDWLDELALGTGKRSSLKGSIPLDTEFSAEDHFYQAVYPDMEHNVFLWAAAGEKDVEIQAIYSQLFTSGIYHGKEQRVDVVSGNAAGIKLDRFLMDENPIENMLTVRLTKEEDGVTYYQDYSVEMKRSLSLKELSVQCDGISAALVQKDGSTGFSPEIMEYDVTVSLAADRLELTFASYEENLCYGEDTVGYRVLVDGQEVTGEGRTVVDLDGSLETQMVRITVENEKAPEGTSEYMLNLLKSPPVRAVFDIAPVHAQLSMYESISGERIWPDPEGAYLLCEGYSYQYTLTRYGYAGKSGILEITRDEDLALVALDGSISYPVTEEEGRGAVTLHWNLEPAVPNETIDTSLYASWPDFRGNSSNNAVTGAGIPVLAEEGTLLWANQLGSGIDTEAVGSPILVDGDLITYAGDSIYRVDTITGEILASGTMDHTSSFSITPPVYADGMIFAALSNGCVQAFHAVTLESLWIYHDPLGGQPNCPLTVRNGYLYTGFWNSETGDANFVCLSITDEDPGQTGEQKCNSWYYTTAGGYYWAGAYAGEDFVLVGTDDGTNRCDSDTSRLLLLDAASGRLLDSCDQLNGDIRSTVVYDSETDAFYFTSKGGTFYSVQVSGDRTLENLWSIALRNGTSGIPMSTCSPVIYQGRAYVGVSGSGQFSAYSGHNITVLDLNSRTIAYQAATQGYPQTSGLLSTAYHAQSGYVYVYFFDNMTPGKLRVLRDKPGMTTADPVTMEGDVMAAYALFTPTGEQAQYAICSPIVDEYGTIYFKNDSAHLMAYGSRIEKIEITKAPDKTQYLAGEPFDPAGMVVTAVYANGSTRDISEYIAYPTEPLTAQDAVFPISFPYVMYHNEEAGRQMTSGIVTRTPVVHLELTVREVAMGDINEDGTIDRQDARLILESEARLSVQNLSPAVADVSGDGIIDSNDAVLILQYAAGKLTAFPAEKKDGMHSTDAAKE